MNVKWRSVLLALLALLALAYNRRIAASLAELRLGEMWREFCWQIWSGPPLGRFTLVAMVLGLLYITVYMLLKNRGN